MMIDEREHAQVGQGMVSRPLHSISRGKWPLARARRLFTLFLLIINTLLCSCTTATPHPRSTRSYEPTSRFYLTARERVEVENLAIRARRRHERDVEHCRKEHKDGRCH